MEENFSIDEILSAVDDIQKKNLKKKLKLLKATLFKKIFLQFRKIL